MENLTKENFWNELQEKYPDGMKVFCDWIDRYKKINNWDKLFNIGSPHYAKMGWHTTKYHDLPFDMQIGIWIRFIHDERGFTSWSIDLMSYDWRKSIARDIESLNTLNSK